MKKVATVDAYLKAVPQPQRATLEKLRADIAAIVPEAEQVITYGMPTFKLGPGYGLVAFGAFKNHCSLFPMSNAVMRDLGGAYATSKGTIQFPPDKPLPKALVKRIVKARVAEDQAMRKARAAKKTTKKKAAAKKK